MGPAGLLRWQWSLYAGTHRNRVNLLLHLCTAPCFWAGTVLLVLAAMGLNWKLLVAAVACLLATLVAQGRGHRLEANPPASFSSLWNFLARLFLEQWITFPRFLLSGGWFRAFHDAR